MSEANVVRYEVQDGIGVITVDNPPVNALGPGVREGIIDGVERANADPNVSAMVLIGAGRSFIAGADIRQFGKPRPQPARRSTDVLDESTKPIVAAIHGYALGGGLEHALSCNYRVAVPSAKVGLPEVLIGVLPGGGGTQRLPRLIGPKAAMEMIVSGRHVPAEEAKKLGIIDEIVDEKDLRGAAIRFAKSIASKRPLPRVSEKTDRIAEAKADPGMFDAMRKSIARRARNQKAPYHCIACVEAAVTQPFQEGLQTERRLFAELENSDEAKALRYAFFAEREVAKIPGAPKDLKPPRVKSAAVIGAGTMGGGIAMCFADFGIPVKVLEVSREVLDKGMQRVRDNYAVSVKRGSITQAQMDERLPRIHPVERYEDIADCDAVIEAVFERIDVKKEVFAKLDAVMKPGALLLTNSSAIDTDIMAGVTKRPRDVGGAHFFAPANVMKLLEVVRGTNTSIETIAATMQIGRDIGKISAVAGTCDGFAANRSRAPLVTEAMLMLEEGALPEQIDKVMVDFGYPMGPFAVSDLSGLDISYDTRKRRLAADPNFRKLYVPDRLVEMGRKGQKTGAGWYRYEAGSRKPIPDPAVEALLIEHSRARGLERRPIPAADIVERCLLGMINEAARILDEGVVSRPPDVDVVWLTGYGFPRSRGGPLFHADRLGAAQVLARIEALRERFGEAYWSPAPLLTRLAASGRGFLSPRNGLA